MPRKKIRTKHPNNDAEVDEFAANVSLSSMLADGREFVVSRCYLREGCRWRELLLVSRLR